MYRRSLQKIFARDTTISLRASPRLFLTSQSAADIFRSAVIKPAGQCQRVRLKFLYIPYLSSLSTAVYVTGKVVWHVRNFSLPTSGIRTLKNWLLKQTLAKVSLCPKGGKQASKRLITTFSRRESPLRFRERQSVSRGLHGMTAQPLGGFNMQRLLYKTCPLNSSTTKAAMSIPSYVQTVTELSNLAPSSSILKPLTRQSICTENTTYHDDFPTGLHIEYFTANVAPDLRREDHEKAVGVRIESGDHQSLFCKGYAG